jgi:catechol 2,3-dioxygenase-like lactoylglutathione lyase family enzyme
MHSITPHLVCAGAAAAIDFYKKAFGATEVARLPGPDGKLMHGAVRIEGSTGRREPEVRRARPQDAAGFAGHDSSICCRRRRFRRAGGQSRRQGDYADRRHVLG